jgi:hypothetical protein
MKLKLSDFFILIAVGFVLLLADRFLRIEPFCNEGFQNQMLQACGVEKLGLNPTKCPSGYMCSNGFCEQNVVPQLKPTMLPVFP